MVDPDAVQTEGSYDPSVWESWMEGGEEGDVTEEAELVMCEGGKVVEAVMTEMGEGVRVEEVGPTEARIKL